ncbi:hypothetical protein KBZ21_40290, partial [Streptomyces sp. A73]|nr:hypothetical protein [Streptomyces sp. A73]
PLTEKAGLIDEGRSSLVNDERERRLVGAVRPLNFGQLKDLQPASGSRDRAATTAYVRIFTCIPPLD